MTVSFPSYEGKVFLKEVKKTNRGMKEYIYHAKGSDQIFTVKAYNRRDAVFRASSRFPNGKFFNPDKCKWMGV